MRLNRSIVLAAVAVLVLGIAGIAVAASTGGNEPARPTTHTLDTQPTAANVSNQLSAELRVLRETAPIGVGMPETIRSIITDDLATRSDANWRLARRVSTSTGPFYLVPGARSLCQISQAGIGCGPAGKIDDDPRAYVLFGFSRATNPKGTLTVAGIVSDSVADISATTAQGKAIPVPITDNVYSMQIPDTFTKLIYRTHDGREFVAPAPSLAASSATPAAPE